MDVDKHAGESGQYIVKSYYFDTLYYQDYVEKYAGVYARQKYRVRTYGDSGYYRLEKKMKKGSLNKKMSGEISAADADLLIRGHTDFSTGNDKTDEIIREIRLRGGKNSVYIEYERQAFTLKELNIRITFDKEISALFGNYSISETMPTPIPVFYQDETILEVKYKDILPGWLQKAIYRIVPSEFSVSKYAESLYSILG
jgi:hypothetical protein